MDRIDLIALLSAALIAGGGWLIQAEAQDMGASGIAQAEGGTALRILR
ncbi:hypothetical protein ACW9UR_00490 [Halovulum sp. GXIMD14794]